MLKVMDPNVVITPVNNKDQNSDSEGEINVHQSW